MRRKKATLIALAALAVSAAPAQAMTLDPVVQDDSSVVAPTTAVKSAPVGGWLTFFIICGGRC